MSFSQLTVRAIYDHKAEIKEEINIQCGDKLTLIDSSKQWWLVKKNGKFGYVPNNFVEIDNLRVKSKYNSNLDMPGVLRMQVGEEFDVIHLVDDYFRVKNSFGEEGLVPKSYVEQMQEVAPSWKKYRVNSHGEYARKDWYFGEISRENAEKELRNFGKQGTYLVRNGSISDYVISVFAENNIVRHIRIFRKDDVLEVGDEVRQPFHSMDSLIAHFITSPIFVDQERDIKIHLRTPLGIDHKDFEN